MRHFCACRCGRHIIAHSRCRSDFHNNPEKCAEKVFKQFDHSANGQLTLEEFLDAMQGLNFLGHVPEVLALALRELLPLASLTLRAEALALPPRRH